MKMKTEKRERSKGMSLPVSVEDVVVVGEVQVEEVPLIDDLDVEGEGARDRAR